MITVAFAPRRIGFYPSQSLQVLYGQNIVGLPKGGKIKIPADLLYRSLTRFWIDFSRFDKSLNFLVNFSVEAQKKIGRPAKLSYIAAFAAESNTVDTAESL